ncbi:Serine/threonine-protein kinase AfsK [Nonomuraea coxensis DSM 45129]|uniref:Serine/threonine-protein kinase AfsK n=1 Tax=Nonomuraea coxensis DSM 45129 TaxID=1122611 RepID=A0ABX8U708_9ACTN|nr:serine/threonine-protein kinase [Nonomuraea coxensis]QYC42539.1 Serine/threonine-protein kinase AfsK [Nonomuraea coxensis DSM 45129]
MARGESGTPPGVRPLMVGDPVVIGRYPLLGRLGAGGMGVVYLAEHPQGGLVALKTPHAAHLHDATLLARFAEEVAFSRRLVPFCTAAVLEDGADRDRPYLVTEYIPGPALSQVVLATGPLAPGLAYGVALGAAAALVAVHEAGFVHRDLKPANVLLSPAGPRVIDFGIARDVTGERGADAHTQAGQVMGSPGWVAPERLTGGAALPAADVFAWGCVVAFAASGRHPYGSGHGADETEAITRRILFEPPRLDGLPVLLRPAVEAALAKDPGRRPGAAELLRALLAAGGVGVPWDLRQAVEGVLGRIWTAVPYPASDATPPPAAPPAAPPVGLPTGQPSGLPSSKGGGRRRPGRRGVGAHLPHATFAALATVSIAAVTVIAAATGPGQDAGGEYVAPPPAVAPQASAGSTLRPRSTRTAGPPPPGPADTPTTLPVAAATTAVAPPAVTTPTVYVTRTRTTAPVTVVTPAPDREDTSRPPAAGEPGDPGPGECANPASRRRGNAAARRGCPRPSVSLTTIPQDGPGESPDPSASASPTQTATGGS